MDLVHSVPVVAKVPCYIALEESLEGGMNLGVSAFENGKLFAVVDGWYHGRELVRQGLGSRLIDAFHVSQ